MRAGFVRFAAVLFVAILAFASNALARPPPTPRRSATPTPTRTPTATPTPTATQNTSIDSGWAPAPDTAAYDPNLVPAPSPEASPAASPGTTGHSSKAALDRHKLELTPGQRLYELTRDASYLDPVSWNVSAFKSRHQLVVYYKGRMYRIYDAVFGRSMEPGTKLWEGDRRTPEGVYTIIEKHPSRRWQWFLGLNYPNVIDHRRYEQLRDAQEVPVADRGEVGEGATSESTVPIYRF